jgi:hypothetical protein
MRITITIIFILSFAGVAWCQESDVYNKRRARNDSLWQDRNQFLSDPIFADSTYQDSVFNIYEGLWACVKIVRNYDGDIKIPKYQDLLLSDGKAWGLDYPCSWNGNVENIHFRNDSVFFNEDRVYIEKKPIEFRGDTLVIFSDKKHEKSHFYVKKEYEPEILASLKAKGFNPTCFQGKWELAHIEDNQSGSWAVREGSFDRVPRILNFDESQVIIDGMLLSTLDHPEIKFEIVQYDRIYSEVDGHMSYLLIKELNKINGIAYYYEYGLMR